MALLLADGRAHALPRGWRAVDQAVLEAAAQRACATLAELVERSPSPVIEAACSSLLGLAQATSAQGVGGGDL